MKGIGSHIVLVGFMGSGKTTVGRLLATSLNMEFIDMDAYIEKQEGSPIREIFTDMGEIYFRELESKALIEILAIPKKVVVSTGGGVPCFGDNMDIIKLNSVSVYMKVGSKRLLERLKGDTSRPLLYNKTDKELLVFVRDKLREREQDYSRADIRIRAIGTPEVLTERLTNYIMKTSL